MPITVEFLDSLTTPPLKEVISIATNPFRKTKVGVWELTTEISPVDLYCYLGARFGLPNGLQNILRKNHSDNLIHWEWWLQGPDCDISIMGLNFRTELRITGDLALEDEAGFDLAKLIKADFSRHGSQMAEQRKSLELWTEFVNPYARLRRSINTLHNELIKLDLKPETDELPNIMDAEEYSAETWESVASKYSQGLGICFGIRSMLPVMAEAYVNLLLFVLMRPELKKDTRLKENTIRQPIDVRIKSLKVTCIGFEKNPDYSSDACKAYHRLVNERNDLLHGNVVTDKLKFNEVHFKGTVPIFKEYRSLWERSIGVEIGAVGLHRLQEEVKTVDNLIAYLNSCLDEKTRQNIEYMARKRELGINQANSRIGVLFSDHIADFRADFEGTRLPLKRLRK